ncbi:hypothetical protein BD770DRAFT_469365 [Pilaira anomala]|nr:hypothetical protein BD770DRAFT_469365 [Pilaira anomala]
MPIVILGDGMFNKDAVSFKRYQHGVTSIIYINFKRRERLGELCLLNTNEFRTSIVCNKCKTKSNRTLGFNFKVLRCTNCSTLLWNRDTMLPKIYGNGRFNIFTIESRTE